jgi:hypothetical protein
MRKRKKEKNLPRYISTKEAAVALGITEEEAEERAAREGWVTKEEYDRWVDILREAQKLHEQKMPHFVIWLQLIQVCERRIFNEETMMALVREAELCIIKDE